MATNNNNQPPSFFYMNEASIHPLLLCPICKRPLVNPVKTPDGRRMCRQCLIDSSWLFNPTRSPDSFEQVDEVIILQILDDLLVKCALCSQTNIRRVDYPKHKEFICMEANVSCTAADLKCPWSGPRNSLEEHVAECRFEPLRPVLEAAMEQLKQLQRHIVQLEDYLDRTIERTPFENQLIYLIRECSNNSLINLQAKQITDDQVEIINEYALRRKFCTILDLNSNGITGQGLERLANALRGNQYLKNLYLANNRCGDRGAIALARVLENSNETLQVLGLESNGIGNEGISALSNMLKTNRTLTHLSLSANQITDHELKMLIDVLVEGPSTLEELNLSVNQGITDQSLNDLKHLIEFNHSLKKLSLIDCQLSPQSKYNLQQLVVAKICFRLIF